MSAKNRKMLNILIYLTLAAFLATASGCSVSGKNIMQAMPKKANAKISPYKIAIAEEVTVDKVLDIYGSVKYNSNEILSFRNNGGHLKAVYAKRGDKVKAGDLLAELDTADLENQLGRKNIELQRLMLRYNELLMDADEYSASGNSELNSIKLDLDALNLNIADISRQISEARLIAPISGVVSSVSTFEIGNTVPTYVPFITISKPGDFVIVSSNVNEKPGDYESPYVDPSGIVTGMKASIVFSNDKSEEVKLPVTITKIVNTTPGYSKDQNRNDSSNDIPLFYVLARPEGKVPDDLAVDDSVLLMINTGKIEKAVIIPKVALAGFADDTIVKVIKNGKVTKRTVVTGYEDKTAEIVVITSGLRPGESVIVE